MNPQKVTIAILAALSASIALAEDFKTIDGKEYKNATVSRVELDGLVLRTKSGISKVYFTELPKEVQERFHYDAQKAAEFTSQAIEKNRLSLQQQAEEAQITQITNKLKSIIIPHVEFRNVTIPEAIDFLRQQATENDSEGKGVNIVLRLVPIGQVAQPSAPMQSGAARITVTLDNIPLGEALRYIANQTGLKVKVEPSAVLVIPVTEQ